MATKLASSVTNRWAFLLTLVKGQSEPAPVSLQEQQVTSWAARAERYFDMFSFQSEYREDTSTKVFTGFGGNTVAAVGRRKFPFAFAFTSERGGIHHLSGTIESWELPGAGPFLFPIDAQARLGLIKDMAKSRIFIASPPRADHLGHDPRTDYDSGAGPGTASCSLEVPRC